MHRIRFSPSKLNGNQTHVLIISRYGYLIGYYWTDLVSYTEGKQLWELRGKEWVVCASAQCC
jgi:hypothetical protein